MERRRVLVVAAAALGGVAGCSGMSEDDGNPSTETANPATSTSSATTTPRNTGATPKNAVRSYVTAVFAGDVQTANRLIHPDGNVEAYSEDAAERMDTLDLTIQSLEITNESKTSATVNAVAAIENTESGEEQTREQTYTVRTADGAWKIYEVDDDTAA